MDKVVHSCSYVYHVPVVADLAERLAEITPGRLQKTFFGNSGAEAVEGALRLARAYTGRREIIALQGSFHGRTAGALAVTGNALRKHRGGAQIAGHRVRADAESVSLPDVLGLVLAGVRRCGRGRHPLRHERRRGGIHRRADHR